MRPKHGMHGTPTYEAWSSMKQRCLNPKAMEWDRYGARGVTVCERWLKFENFLADVGVRPDGLTLDRFPNNNGNYEPGNVRWATPKEQANNRRPPTLRPRCKHGHAFTLANTRVRVRDGRTSRVCRTCHRTPPMRETL